MEEIRFGRKYRRVSTDEQADSGTSLQAQSDRLDAFAVSQGWKVVGDYVDDGYSAKTLNRPAIQRLLKEIKPGEVILVHKLDRLTRSARDLETLLELAEERQIYFRSATETIDTFSSSGRMFVRLIVNFAQWERETISERTAIGKKQKVKQGEWQGGPIPFGYLAIPSERVKNGRNLLMLVPDPATKHLLPMIYEKYLAGNGMRSICIWLNDELGVTTKAGARWRVPTLVRIMTNPIYCGDVIHGRRNRATVTRTEGSHEPLVSRELFERVQETLAMRKTFWPRQATGKYPFAGVARCGVCGGRIDAMLRRKKGIYVYRCNNYVNGVGCGSPPLTSVSSRIVEANFIKEMEAFASPSRLDEFLRTVKEYEERDNLPVEIERVESDLEQTNQAIARYKRLFESGRIGDDEYMDDISPLKERAKVLAEQLSVLKEQESEKPDVVNIGLLAVNIAEAWEGLEPEERKSLVQRISRLGVEIRLYPDRSVQVVFAGSRASAR